MLESQSLAINNHLSPTGGGCLFFTAWRDSNRGHLARRRGALQTEAARPQAGESLLLRQSRIAIVTRQQSCFFAQKCLEHLETWLFSAHFHYKIKRNPEPGLCRIRILAFMA